MKRLGIILIILAVAVLSLGSLGGCAKPTPKKEFTLVYESLYPAAHIRMQAQEDMLDQIEEASNGRIKFERHYGGEPVTKKEALDALGKGTIDLLTAYATYYDGKVGIADWHSMPANFRSWEDVWELGVNGKVMEISDKIYQELANVKFVAVFPVAPYNFQVSKKVENIRHFEDFEGLKIRSAGGAASEAVKCLGAEPVLTIGGEYYPAMQKGIVDAGLMTTYSLEQYKMWEVCDQIVDPPLITYSSCPLFMNLDAWNELGPDLQELIMGIARGKEIGEKWLATYAADDARITKTAKEKGVEFYVLPQEDAEKMYKATLPVWDWYIEINEKQGKGAEAREIRDMIQTHFFK